MDLTRRLCKSLFLICGKQPADTLRSLAESKRMLEETRRELAEARERAQLTPTHTFSPLPGFFDRPAEIRALEKALEVGANFTVLFGASSVGKVRGSVQVHGIETS